MKNKHLFFIAAAIALMLPVQAQINSAIVFDTSSYGLFPHSVVRNLTTTEVIEYHVDTQRPDVYKGYFVYKDNSTLSYKRAELPDDIVVYDFRIFGDYVYFCGEDRSSAVGILGFFKCTDLTTGPVSYSWLKINNSTQLNRIVVYKDPGSSNPRVVALGYNSTISCPGSYVCNMAVDCIGLTTLPNPIAYNTRQANSMADIEQWTDIVATDSYLAIVGFLKIGSDKGLIIRRCDPSDPLGSMMDDVYMYPFTEDLSIESIKALSWRDDTIIMAYPWRSQIGNNYTDIRFFHLGSMLNTKAEQYKNQSKTELYEMAYLPTSKKLIILEDFDCTGSGQFSSCFVYINPLASTLPYSTPYVYDKTYRFKSVTNLDGNHFVGSGYFCFLMCDVNLPFPINNVLVPPPSTPPYCPFDDRVIVSEDRAINYIEFIDNTPKISYNDYLNSGGCNVFLLPLWPYCIN